jgi:hypothetical protein
VNLPRTRTTRDFDAMDALPASQVSLQRAVRILRAVRERYETGCDVHSAYVRAYSVQVALGCADMLWITAAIEALEKQLLMALPPE